MQNTRALHPPGPMPSEAQRSGGHSAGRTDPGCSSVCGWAGRLRGDLGWWERGGNGSLVCQNRRQGFTCTVRVHPVGEDPLSFPFDR